MKNKYESRNDWMEANGGQCDQFWGLVYKVERQASSPVWAVLKIELRRK